jgi:curved DNA-binding protein
MQDFRDYYEILGVTQDASNQEIKRAFRRLARRYHPDVNPGDQAALEKFKDINEAKEVLSNPDKREQYDQFSRSWRKKNKRKTDTTFRTSGKSNGTGRKDDVSPFVDFGELREHLLGRRPSRRTTTVRESEPPGTRITSPNRFQPGRRKLEKVVSRSTPKDVEARLTLPLEKAYEGGRERIRLEDGRSLEIDMPPGMITGQRIRLKGQGIAGGNLFLKITVSPHPFFQLEGSDIVCQVPVTPSEAVLGGLIEVPTLDGRVKMNVPSGVWSGQRLRLADKGYPTAGGGRGDQLVEIQIVVPKDPNPQVRDLYRQLQEIEDFNPRLDLPR